MGDLAVAVVILHWRNLQDTEACLDSVYRSRGVSLRVVLVDNGSGDDLRPFRRRYPDLSLLPMRENVGFAAGNNAGIREALRLRAGAVLLLNNDARLAPDALSRMLEMLQNGNNIGAVVPKVNYLDARRLLWYAGGRIQWWRVSVEHFGFRQPDGPEFSVPRDVSFATGCALLVRAEVFNRVGLFREEFYSYFEDAEFSLRLLRHGYRIRFCPWAQVLHRVGAGTRLREYSPYYLYYQTRNRLAALLPYRGSAYRFYARIFNFLVYFLLRIVLVFFGGGTGKTRKAAAVWQGYWDSVRRKTGPERRWEEN